MKQNGLRDEEQLQSYFVKRVGRFLTSRGKRMVGWDEILEGGLAPGAIVMSWRGESGGIEAAPARAQGNHGHPPITAISITTRAIPAASPQISAALSRSRRSMLRADPEGIAGRSAAIPAWGTSQCVDEYIGTPEYLEYMLFPAIAGVFRSGLVACLGQGLRGFSTSPAISTGPPGPSGMSTTGSRSPMD